MLKEPPKEIKCERCGIIVEYYEEQFPIPPKYCDWCEEMLEIQKEKEEKK